MKKLLLVVLAAGAVWWYFVGGRSLSRDQVNAFYRDLEVATLQRKPENICSLLAPDFQSTGTVTVVGQRRTDAQNKNQTCDAYRDLYATWEKLGEKMGGMLQLDSSHTIHSVTLSPDNKSATVNVSSTLDVAGSIMNIRPHSTDTLVRRNGKVLVLRSEGVGSIGTSGTGS